MQKEAARQEDTDKTRDRKNYKVIGEKKYRQEIKKRNREPNRGRHRKF